MRFTLPRASGAQCVNPIETCTLLTDPQSVILDPRLEHFESTNVTVIIKWMEENPFYLYHITVIPQVEVTFTGRVQVQLNVLYNTFYNVSVVASSPCGLGNATNITELFISELFLDTVPSRKRAPPPFGLNFLLRSSVYSNMRPCEAALENAA